jgi:hypothetical protein
VDVSRVKSSFLEENPRDRNPHHPVKNYCTKRNMWLESKQAPFIVHYHYSGTYEQFCIQDDSRDWARSWEALGVFRGEKYAQVYDNATCPWLSDVVDSHGSVVS